VGSVNVGLAPAVNVTPCVKSFDATDAADLQAGTKRSRKMGQIRFINDHSRVA
jgi:hypothetical protein